MGVTFIDFIKFILALMMLGFIGIGIPLIYYMLLTKSKKSLNYVLIFFLFFIFNPPGMIIVNFMANHKISKETGKIIDNVIKSPCDNSVNDFIAMIDNEKYTISNTPNSWHKIRGIWYVVNESPNVSTTKKKELKNFLMTKGLYLHKDEGQIIDNYSK